ncbi:MAG: PilZ domain-containing protein [Candidatus Omnitrophica bacterium]|nr:PilZ domain-containing protein [Candidatus Omnitrophota bacterium]
MADDRSRDVKFNERRDSVRADRVVAVQHRLVKRTGRKQAATWSLSTTKNMSLGGLLFLSAIPYKSGDIIELEVVMSGVIDIYKGLARVVRTQESSSTSFDVAVQYVEVKFKSRAAKTHLRK